MNNTLTDTQRLEMHEQGLRDNAESMLAFAMHLYGIKQYELYRSKGYRSFLQYCQEEVPHIISIPLSQSRLYQLAEWAGVNEEVSTIVETPLNEAQARALKAVPESERAEVLEAVAESGDVTAKRITGEIERRERLEEHVRKITSLLLEAVQSHIRSKRIYEQLHVLEPAKFPCFEGSWDVLHPHRKEELEAAYSELNEEWKLNAERLLRDYLAEYAIPVTGSLSELHIAFERDCFRFQCESAEEDIARAKAGEEGERWDGIRSFLAQEEEHVNESEEACFDLSE